LFAPIVENLAKVGLLERARVALEKPFGHDFDSALELNARLARGPRGRPDPAVDHFLGKQPVVELEYLRFANLGLAKLWTATACSEIQITMAEKLRVDDRGKFYDAVGTLRDVVQNHLLQVLAVVAMEPPVGPSADDLDERGPRCSARCRARSAALCAWSVPRLYRYRRRGKRFRDRDLCRVSDRDRQLALGRRADLPAGRKALAERVTEVRLFLRRTPSLAFSARPPTGGTEPRWSCASTPIRGCGCQLSGLLGDSWHDIHLDSSFAVDSRRTGSAL